MSAKDTADAILRDFRTSMAPRCCYYFSDISYALDVLYELWDLDGCGEWFSVCGPFANDHTIHVELNDPSGRDLSI